MAAAGDTSSAQDFLLPLHIDLPKVIDLAAALSTTYKRLAAESENQFLPTPVSDSILRPSAAEGGRYLAIDFGGTNLRVGFIELSNITEDDTAPLLSNGAEGSRMDESRVRRISEKSWPIGDHLKHEKAEDLFAWVGECIAEVVEDGCRLFGEELGPELSMGVTFSFPMIQHTISDATLMSMGKGFAITSNLDLGKQLRAGYAQARSRRPLPDVKIVAIVNDTVATLISFAYQLKSSPQRKAAMGLIVGTGNNATIPLKLSSLHSSKRPKLESVMAADSEEQKILVNTEWSINGTAGPLQELNLITKWDRALDAEESIPGFQPFEYMTAGRCLGELGRLIIVDYLMTELKVPFTQLPPKLCQRNGLTTASLGKFGSSQDFDSVMISRDLSREFPANGEGDKWEWTPIVALMVYHIAKSIQVRAAGMTAAAIVGLLICAKELTLDPSINSIQRGYPAPQREELMVGYTGGCIVHFQDYLKDCQGFLDQIMEEKFVGEPHLRVILEASHDGGIVGAGVLAATVKGLESKA